MRLDKIYTKTGDHGRTSLVTGERVEKYDERVEAFGTIDELNSTIGMIRTCALGSPEAVVVREAEGALRQIQNDLFDLGAIVACSPGLVDQVLPAFPDGRAAYLEAQIDRCQEQLDALTTFVLPGGNMLNAYAHLARTVCRRGERLLWKLHAREPVPEAILTYINRLSDYLFVLSRWVLKTTHQPEFIWVPGGGAAEKAASPPTA